MSDSTPRASFIASRPAVFVAISVGAAAALLAVALLWKEESSRTDERRRIVDAVDVIVPAPLSEEETQRTTTGFEQERVALEAGAWVQVADEQGRLQQRYRAERIDPEPDRWVRMAQPRAVMYSGTERVITMRADRGRARIPRQALQAGHLEGDVRIRVFRAPKGGAIRFEGDEPVGEPTMVILAEEAQFDEILGEIRCDRWVELTARQEAVRDGATERTTIAFKGEGLSINVDSEQRTIERLVVERADGPIVITRHGRELLPDSVRSTGPGGGAATDGSEVVAASGADAPGIPTAEPPSAAVPAAPTGDSAGAAANETAAAPGPGEATAPPSDSTAPSAPADFRPYRLTLHDNVVIRRINRGRESVVRGDRLVALFALESEGLRDALTGEPRRARLEATRAATEDSFDGALDGALEWWTLPTTARWTMLAIAAAQSPAPSQAPTAEPEVDLITIHYDGRLVMVPAIEQRDLLKNPDDLLLTVEADDSGPKRYVEVEDVRTLARARCQRIVYHGAADAIDLEGSLEQPFELRSPQMDLRGGAFHFHRPSGHGEVQGAGTMRLGEADEPAKQAPPARELEIVWSKGLDIELADEQSGGRIKSAHFEGDVKVDGTDFGLTTKALRVYFAEKGDNVVERIRAEGDASATRLGDAGSLAAQVIDVTLALDSEGKPIPAQMEARGGVTARDRNQTMWSDALRVFFREKPASSPESGESPPRDRVLASDDLGSVEIERVIAGTLLDEAPGGAEAAADAGADAANAAGPARGVQMLLKDGARVFARRLDGDATKRQVELLGPDVMIVQKNLVADRLTHLFIDETARTVTANGPGRFRYFREPVGDAAPSPRERPDPQGPLSLDATWSEKLHYDDRGNGGGGTIDLDGGVRVRASRTNREFSALDAQRVQLDLRRDPESAGRGVGSSTAEGAAGDAGASDDAFGGGVRQIERLIAKEGARLESQTWTNDARTGEPRLFRVTGDHVEYDTLTGEALVAGPGSLLVHDRNPDSGAGAAGGLDARGSSRFKWATSMDMKRLGSQRYLVTMKDGVEVLHSGLKENDTLTLTCDQLETTLLRPGVGEQAGAARAAPRVEVGPVDLGGAAELLRVRGLGRVMVRAPDADIECDEFDYDVPTQIAQLKGRDGRLVKVLRSGASSPVQASSVLWDRQTGRITVQSGSGAVGR